LIAITYNANNISASSPRLDVIGEKYSKPQEDSTSFCPNYACSV
jgi:hypothetical protein